MDDSSQSNAYKRQGDFGFWILDFGLRSAYPEVVLEIDLPNLQFGLA
jgi:hypothetical protein